MRALNETLQWGKRVTGNLNFIVRSITSGVFEICRGTLEVPGDTVFKIDAAGKIEVLNLFSSIDDVTSNRAWATQYTNTKKVPMFITVGVSQGGAADIYAQFTVAGKLMPLMGAYAPSAGYRAVITCMVPAGATYRLDTAGSDTINSWIEQY